MIRVLVTGSNGQLGMTIRELAPEFPDMEFYFTDKSTLDITRLQDVVRSFQEFNPHYCINCAAYTQVDQAERTPKPAYQVNVDGVENLIMACKKHDSVLIHISTDYVFDGEKKEGYFPQDRPNPINVYGKTKLKGEKVIQSNLKRFFIVRTSWLYSRVYGNNFFKRICEKVKEGKTFYVTDDQKGCPTNTKNLAIYILKLISQGNRKFGIHHFTDGEPMTWFDFALKIQEECASNKKASILRGNPDKSNLIRRPLNSILRQ